MNIIPSLVIGLIAGMISGAIGIGGGVVIIPALIFLFGFSQHLAQGTTLALMIPPIGIFAAYIYYKQGFVDIPVAIFICLGFVIGGLIGAKFAISIPDIYLKKIFWFSMLLISLYMLISK